MKEMCDSEGSSGRIPLRRGSLGLVLKSCFKKRGGMDNPTRKSQGGKGLIEFRGSHG